MNVAMSTNVKVILVLTAKSVSIMTVDLNVSLKIFALARLATRASDVKIDRRDISALKSMNVPRFQILAMSVSNVEMFREHFTATMSMNV